MGSEIFVESDRISKTKRKNNRRLLIVVAIIATVVAAALLLWNTEQGRSILAKLGIPTAQKDAPQDKDAESRPTNMLNYNASQSIASGNTQAAIDMYKTEIDKTSNKEQKAQKLLDISNLLWNNGEATDSNKQLALDYAKQAEELNPTAQTAAALFLIYQAMGNTTEAQRYQKLLDERGGDSAPDSNGGR